MPRLKVSLSIGFVGAVHEEILDIDDDEWASCETDDEREDLMQEYWKDWSGNYIDGSCSIVE